MKDIVISKDLINLVYPNIKEVLGDDYSYAIDKEVHYANDKLLFEQYNIVFSGLGEQLFEINLSTFTFKCKEWAFKQGYEIHTNLIEVIAIFKEVSKICNHGHFERLPLKSWQEIEYEADTKSEVEAIITACEYIITKV